MTNEVEHAGMTNEVEHTGMPNEDEHTGMTNEEEHVGMTNEEEPAGKTNVKGDTVASHQKSHACRKKKPRVDIRGFIYRKSDVKRSSAYPC
jgi:hypothetical protein